MGLLLLIILILAFWPSWPYSAAWGFGPSGALGLVLIILLIWVIAGGRPLFRNTSADVNATVHDAGHDLKAAGRNAAESIRNALQP
ncbi:MAG: DUF3309 domain-containing protein [Candidatus Omnitrophica bacterium]|nr:DUF3309 domain-containing protein [Candidatus Omnitrophota bacterium]MDE2222247.1 DUF3309 domain-containing protein [Candidatus Omnitrophota bacterium]